VLDVGPTASRLGSAGSALIEISVSGSNAHKVAEAADLLARNTAVVFSTYARRELRLSSSNLAVVSAELRDVSARLNVDQSQLQQLATDPRSTTPQRLVEIKTFAGQVAEDGRQRTLLQQELLAARLQTSFEQGIQLPRLTRPAESVPRGGPSLAAGVVVGALADPVNHPREPLGYTPPTRRVRYVNERGLEGTHSIPVGPELDAILAAGGILV
jgi:hypothetical protein